MQREREGEALGRLGKIRAYDKERRRKAKRALSSAARVAPRPSSDALDTLRGALECVDLETGELHRPEHVQRSKGKVARGTEDLRNRAPGPQSAGPFTR